jgi:hypothetical protein
LGDFSDAEVIRKFDDREGLAGGGEPLGDFICFGFYSCGLFKLIDDGACKRRVASSGDDFLEIRKAATQCGEAPSAASIKRSTSSR